MARDWAEKKEEEKKKRRMLPISGWSRGNMTLRLRTRGGVMGSDLSGHTHKRKHIYTYTLTLENVDPRQYSMTVCHVLYLPRLQIPDAIV
jgi:hypothetical protein